MTVRLNYLPLLRVVWVPTCCLCGYDIQGFVIERTSKTLATSGDGEETSGLNLSSVVDSVIWFVAVR